MVNSFLNSLLNEFKNVSNKDWLHTVTKFTSYAVHRNYKKFVEDETKVDELIISGGGAKKQIFI